SSWGPEFKWLCNPVLSCHSCALAWFACPIGVFIHYAGFHLFPFFALGTVLLLGVLIGRLLCGWVCPFGFLQDLLYKVPSPKIALPEWTSYFKYGVLLVMVLALPFFLGEQTLLSFCRFCPASALQVTIPNFFLDGAAPLSLMTVIKLLVLAVVLVAAIASSRSFCRVLCPIGALLAPLNYVSLWKITVPTQNCLRCKACAQACPQQGHPAERIARGVPSNRALDCIVCHECQTICPSAEIEARLETAKRKRARKELAAAAAEGRE
ncbi:MAG: 4Fe-4S binding protein, partial [Candidatus Hydrogenedentes bacterium]|nr:4Fe-4S binding protein [Candidatus Hydrogenedentota bacterium]